MARNADFDSSVPLPPGLDGGAIRRALQYIEKEAAEWIDLYFEQANLFSAFVGILGTRVLDSISPYEKHRNVYTAQQRFPDLKRRGSGAAPTPRQSLESKGSVRPWAVQAHYDHSGWYMVWRYLVDPTLTLEPGKPVLVWRVDVVFLERSDWKYEGSTAGLEGGGRTHTYGLRQPATKLRDKAVYKRKDVIIRNSKPAPRNGNGA